MFNEDNDAVETVEATETEAVTEPVETVEAEPVEAADTNDVTPVEVEEEIDVPPVFDWNGEFESLRDSEWAQKLEPEMRKALLEGIEGKYQNWQRGYTNKYQDLAKQRREAEDLMKEVREQEVKVQRWLHGDIDPMIAKQKEIDELKVAHRAALSALRKEAEAAHEKATQSHGLAMETAAKERDDALRRYQEVHGQLEQFQESQVELQVDSLEKWLTAEASDVYDNDDAFDKFCELARANFTPEDAVKMVRAIYPDPFTHIDVISNTTGLHLHPTLPQMLLAAGATLAVSIHSKEHPNYIKKFKSGYQLAKQWKNDLGVTVEFWDTNKEWVRQYKGFGDTMMPFEDNNPRKSWEVCISKYAMQLHEGKLWKCPALAYLPMQAKKYNLSEKWEPYLKYKPLDVDCTDDELEEFLNREDEPTCSMCPMNRDVYTKPDPTLPVSHYEKLYGRV